MNVKKIIDVDLAGSFFMAKYVVCHMISRNEGKIINICSMMIELGRDTAGAYAAVKGGLKMLTISMAAERAHYNIRANGIGPGYFAASQAELMRNNARPFSDFIKTELWPDVGEIHLVLPDRLCFYFHKPVILLRGRFYMWMVVYLP